MKSTLLRRLGAAPHGLSPRAVSYDITGTVVSATDNLGHSVSVTSDMNNTVPHVITPNSNPNLQETLTWTSFLGLATDTGPNTAQTTTSYDSYARPQSSVSVHGATTTYSYSTSPPYTTATMNGKWVKTSMDGLGRTIKMETGYGSTTVSTVDTEYDSCACSPLGKMKRVSQPYAPNGTVYWTTYTYDGLGRTTSVSLPGNTGTTTYVYQGNTVTVTDPAGKWKKYTSDALGNLVKVTEPNPAGGADVEANYTYNLRSQLTQVSMTRSGTTQTRTFNYDLPTGRLASATNPENGTVSYTYNTDATLASKTDARNQQVQYSYDSYQRVTQIRRYSGTWPYAEDPCQRVDFYYDTNPFDSQYSQNAWGRVAAAQWGGVSCTGGTWQEQYSYLAAGRATKKKLVRVGLTSLEGVWTYDNEGKMTSVQYPNGGPTFSYTFDSMGRPVKLTDNAGTPRDWVKDVAYNAAGQITGMSYVSYFDDNGLPQYFGETRTYNVRQQLTRLTTQKQWYPTTVADLEYRFSGTQNNGRITQRKDWVSGEEVTYQYDALNRLISAVTTGPEWGQSFGYDGFGNLLSQTVTKGSAPVLSINVDGATNRIATSGFSYDANGNMTAMPFVTMSYDIENRLAQATHSSNGTDNYVYDPSNRRVWKQEPSCQGCGSVERISFYGVDGTLMQAGTGMGAYDSNYTNINVYFAGKLVWREYSNGMWGGVAVDRLGSVVGDNWAAHSYFPFGEEKVTTSQNLVKFATYYRDATTALDYANQRYYGRTFGRFVTPDPADAGDTTNPQSFNLYSYVLNDPVNLIDPEGLAPCGSLLGFGTGGQTLADLMHADTTAGLFARVIWAESSRNILQTGADRYFAEKEAVGWSIRNRYSIMHGQVTVTDAGGHRLDPSTLDFVPRSIGSSATYADIIGYGGFRSVVGGGNASLTPAFQSSLDHFLNADMLDTSFAPLVGLTDPSTGEVYPVNLECYNITQSYVAGNLASTGALPNPFAGKGLVTSFNTTGESAGPYLQAFGKFGPTYFFGFSSAYVHPPAPPIPRGGPGRRRTPVPRVPGPRR